MSARSDWMDVTSMPVVQMWEVDTDASVSVITMERDYRVNVSGTVNEYTYSQSGI